MKLLLAVTINALIGGLAGVCWRTANGPAAAFFGVLLLVALLVEIGSFWPAPRPSGAPLTYDQWEQQREDTRRAAMANLANPAAKGPRGRRRES